MTLQKFIYSCELWLRLAMFILGPLRDALLNVLHNNGVPNQPKDLYNFLNSKKSLLARLKGKGVITQPQWRLLFPGGKNETDSNLFDITLIMLLIEALTSIKPNDGDWRNNNQPVMDISVGAFCIRAKSLRNYLNHFPNIADLKNPDFSTKWSELLIVINGLKYNTPFNVNDLKTVSLDLQNNLLLRALVLSNQVKLNHHDAEIDQLRNKNMSYQNQTNLNVTNLEEKLERMRCKIWSNSFENKNFREDIEQTHISILQMQDDISYLKDYVKDLSTRTEDLEHQSLSTRMEDLESQNLQNRTEALEGQVCEIKSQYKAQEVDYN
ncbi:uncharacterized protein LOC130647589 [Hydractinia symbiolongicarpus]|uniref:uncharacterized protein LOC130647589 n=1 Tax=Hydractinia symbiolongicarpus TaxID=13093 RepID=UPI00254C78E4|nr:uncharacterized protein LOC130647589 [Hydractinia symbiolongicarpus]